MFLIFGGECYYADGGGCDYLGKSADFQVACEIASALVGRTAVTEIMRASDDFVMSHEIEWTHVFSVADEKIVATYGSDPYGGEATVEVRP